MGEPDDQGFRRDDFCFACGQQNENGLRLQPAAGEGRAVVRWTPPPHYQGYAGVLHGGIISTILDEAMAHAAISLVGRAATAELSLQFLKPVMTGRELEIRAEVRERKRRILARRRRADPGRRAASPGRGEVPRGGAGAPTVNCPAPPTPAGAPEPGLPARRADGSYACHQPAESRHSGQTCIASDLPEHFPVDGRTDSGDDADAAGAASSTHRSTFCPPGEAIGR